MKRFVLKFLLVLSVCSGNAYSETQSNVVGDSAGLQQDASGGASADPANSATSGNSISQGVVKEELKDSSTVQANPENDSRGREYKANDSKSQANTGAAIAAATGAALVARGTPMLGSPIAAVRAAGADLVAKGALEFAQAAASKKAANENGDQKNLLTQNYDEGRNGGAPTGGANNKGEAEEKLNLNSPELENLLASRGISPDEFSEAITSGALTSSADVLRAIGEDPETISTDDQTEANSLSGNIMGDIFADMQSKHPDPKRETLSQGMDEGNGREVAGGAVGTIGSGDLNAVAMYGGAVTPPVIVDPLGGQPTIATGKSADSDPDSFFAEGRDFLSRLLGVAPGSAGKKSPNAKAHALGVRTEKELKLIGISPTRRGNIFQMATQNFRSFYRWSKPIKFASQP